MNILTNFLKGWALVARHPLFLLFKWALNLIFALLLLAPLTSGLARFLDHRAGAENFVSQPSLAGIFEFLRFFEPEIQGLTESWFLLLAIFAVLNIVLTAGYLNVFAADARGEKASFRMGVRRHFLSLGLTPIWFGALLFFGVTSWDRFVTLDLPSWSQPIQVLVLFWLIWFIWLVYDYTRISICARPETHSPAAMQVLAAIWQPVTAFFRAVVFVVSKPNVWFLALLFLLIQALWVFGMSRGWFGDQGGSTTMFALLIGQLLILARIATGLALLGAETALWVDGHRVKVSQSVPQSAEETFAFTQPPEPDEGAEGRAESDESGTDESGMLGDDDDEAYLLAGRRQEESN